MLIKVPCFTKNIFQIERIIFKKLGLWNQNKNEESKIDVMEDFIKLANQSLCSKILNKVHSKFDCLFHHFRELKNLEKWWALKKKQR